MAVITVSAIIGGFIGAIGWFNTLPPQFKYLIFLGGLTADSFIAAFSGFQSGIVGGLITEIIKNTFNIPNFLVTSWQLLVIFTFLPFVLFLLKNSLSHQ